MSDYQGIFKRYEKKYMMNEDQYKALMQDLKDHITQDLYGLHTISNIYFDTDSYELIRYSIEKPVYKEKLRLRCYGTPKPGDPVFIELKKKYEGVVYKRRVQLTLAEAQRYLMFNKLPDGPIQILDEIDWFMKRCRPVPKVFIAYDRLAFYGSTDSNLRITIDRDIRFRDHQLDLSKGAWGTPLLEHGQILMEIKMPGAMPLWLSQILAGLEIYPASFSKYGNLYTEHLIHRINQKGGIICA